jgi:hypothetical protein
MRGFRAWLLANSLGVMLMIAIAEIDKWNRIDKGWLNRPSIPQEVAYVRLFLLFAVSLGALQVVLCYGLMRLIPIRNRILGATYGTITGILLPFLGLWPASRLLSVYGAESLMCIFVLLPIGMIAGALTGRTTPGS